MRRDDAGLTKGSIGFARWSTATGEGSAADPDVWVEVERGVAGSFLPEDMLSAFLEVWSGKPRELRRVLPLSSESGRFPTLQTIVKMLGLRDVVAVPNLVRSSHTSMSYRGWDFYLTWPDGRPFGAAAA